MRTRVQKVALSAMLALLGVFQFVTGIVERNYLRAAIGALLFVAATFTVVKRYRAGL